MATLSLLYPMGCKDDIYLRDINFNTKEMHNSYFVSAYTECVLSQWMWSSTSQYINYSLLFRSAKRSLLRFNVSTLFLLRNDLRFPPIHCSLACTSIKCRYCQSGKVFMVESRPHKLTIAMRDAKSPVKWISHCCSYRLRIWVSPSLPFRCCNWTP